MRSGLYRNLLLLSAIICLTGATITPILYGATNSIKAIEIVYPKQPDRDKILSKYRIASLFFIENRGQFPEEVLFQIHANGATLYLCKDKVVTILTKIEKKNYSQLIASGNDSKLTASGNYNKLEVNGNGSIGTAIGIDSIIFRRIFAIFYLNNNFKFFTNSHNQGVRKNF